LKISEKLVLRMRLGQEDEARFVGLLRVEAA
jgi:hypothetical protein